MAKIFVISGFNPALTAFPLDKLWKAVEATESTEESNVLLSFPDSLTQQQKNNSLQTHIHPVCSVFSVFSVFSVAKAVIRVNRCFLSRQAAHQQGRFVQCRQRPFNDHGAVVTVSSCRFNHQAHAGAQAQRAYRHAITLAECYGLPQLIA